MNRVEGCEECSRLWSAYAGSTHQLLKLQGKLQVAEFSFDRQQEALLRPEVENAAQERIDARVAIERHIEEAHPDQTVLPLREAADSGSSTSTETELRESVARARAELLKVISEQGDLMNDVPSGLPSPDGAFRLEAVGKLRKAKYKRYMESVGALNRFLKESASK